MARETRWLLTSCFVFRQPGHFPILISCSSAFDELQIFCSMSFVSPSTVACDPVVERVSKARRLQKAPIGMEAIKKHISGKIVVQFVLDIGGNIKESTALEGDPILSAAVMDAVKQWKFAPIRWTVTPWKWFLKSRWDLVSAN